ncbi:MAG: hypothetical protein WCR47_00580 [Desulfoplanes sp.]
MQHIVAHDICVDNASTTSLEDVYPKTHARTRQQIHVITKNEKRYLGGDPHQDA